MLLIYLTTLNKTILEILSYDATIYVQPNDDLYQQKFDIAIGSSLYLLFSNVFMVIFEQTEVFSK